MRFFTRAIAFIFLLSFSVTHAQDATKTIDEQFTEVIEGSNNYQQFKVIDKVKMTRLQQNAKARIDVLQSEIENLKSEMNKQQTAASKVSADLEKIQLTLTETEEEKDSINFFGIQMSKGSYQTMMWSIIGLLLLGLVFFIFKFRSSNVLTKEAQHKLDETEVEFDEYRRKALEKEQKLGRQLQDERNKALKSAKG
ncbi:hypothetical protein [uncultured Dokdonia sp.]|jgi:uncharacterized membrane-anchored protein YhcB (DUF1043 family)|uniref:hypothetical protein n=1 Tax=unclassified Dokdonia TaxID=2615033 RepID=UPI00260F51D6|nr:hypothetical protein [uncultured Dokdonia sp.]|tara:strand:- start:48970 stop:49557 length:588 start_codon:yes stop_codon:yes gene_type:complete